MNIKFLIKKLTIAALPLLLLGAAITIELATAGHVDCSEDKKYYFMTGPTDC